MTLETDKLKQALARELSNARAPYEGTIGEVYTERAWRRGAEYMTQRCIQLIEDCETGLRKSGDQTNL